MISNSYYGTLSEANAYFQARLHEQAWSDASATERESSLIEAREIIDSLAYKGQKSTVYTLLQATPAASDTDIRAAEAAQVLEFPRGEDTQVPDDIKQAGFEIANALLDGVDIQFEIKALGISSQGLESVRTTYSRSHQPVEHIINGVPSFRGWRLLRPFLRDEDTLKLVRV